MIKQKLKVFLMTLAAASLITVIIPSQSFAQEGEGGYDYSGSDSGSSGGVNSGFFGLILQGGLGSGGTLYGALSDTSSSSSNTLGAGPGANIDLSVMANFSILALKLEYNYSSFTDMEITINGVNFKEKGDGGYSTVDATIGLKAFTEEGDMGYTHFYGGYRFWSLERNVTEVTPAGTPYKHEQEGGGWIFGVHDLSTFPLGGVSLALNSALWFDSAPYSSFKSGGTEISADVTEAGGFGMDLGLGVAFEDSGLLLLVGWKMDVMITTFSTAFYDDNTTGTGYSLLYISAAIEF